MKTLQAGPSDVGEPIVRVAVVISQRKAVPDLIALSWNRHDSLGNQSTGRLSPYLAFHVFNKLSRRIVRVT